jgi:hypothetical protein
MILVLFEQIRTKFERKHIYTDSAYWYNDDACKWLRLTQAYHLRNNLKNIMERFIQQVKDMTD